MFAIAAVSQNWGIGKDNHLLFHISADMKRFRELTEGKTVLMGRKTLQSLPGGKGLPRRRSIVLTANPDFAAPDAETAHTPVQAVFSAGEETAIIGGESVYRLFLPLCERVYITKVFADAEADTFFPDLDADPQWLAEGLTDFGFDRNLYTFARDGFAPFREEYKAACVNLGRRVTFDLPDGGQGTGEAVDVDEEGRLVVRTDSGEVHVFTGEVSVHGIYGAV